MNPKTTMRLLFIALPGAGRHGTLPNTGHRSPRSRCTVAVHHICHRGTTLWSRHEDRSNFLAFELVFGTWTEVIGLITPGKLQLAEVRRVNLIERAIARVRQIGPVSRPVAFLR